MKNGEKWWKMGAVGEEQLVAANPCEHVANPQAVCQKRCSAYLPMFAANIRQIRVNPCEFVRVCGEQVRQLANNSANWWTFTPNKCLLTPTLLPNPNPNPYSNPNPNPIHTSIRETNFSSYIRPGEHRRTLLAANFFAANTSEQRSPWTPVNNVRGGQC